MRIRDATLMDFRKLYVIGLRMLELLVSANEPFMEKDDFRLRLQAIRHVFMLAEEQDQIIGFICANSKDVDRPLMHKWACIVYFVVPRGTEDRGSGLNSTMPL